MKSTTWAALAVTTLAALVAGNGLTLAASTQAAAAPEAAISFANHGGIRDWNALDDKGIWIQSVRRQWYYATFFGPCTGLQFETAVRFLPGPTGTLDKWSGVLSRQSGRCRFSSLKASDTPPPVRTRKGNTPEAPAESKAPTG
jgi:hypothetical protein